LIILFLFTTLLDLAYFVFRYDLKLNKTLILVPILNCTIVDMPLSEPANRILRGARDIDARNGEFPFLTINSLGLQHSQGWYHHPQHQDIFEGFLIGGYQQTSRGFFPNHRKTRGSCEHQRS